MALICIAKEIEVKIKPYKKFFLKIIITPDKTRGIKEIARALVLCPTWRIIKRYVEKPNPNDPKTEYFHGNFKIVKKIYIEKK